MHKGLFRYNPKTCRYEPAPYPTGKVLGWLLFFLFCSGCFFVVYARLQGLFFPTTTMQNLTQENRAYARHIQNLRSELALLQSSLTEAGRSEKELMRKIFGQEPSVTRSASTAYSLADNPFEMVRELNSKVSGILTATRKGEVVHLHPVNIPNSWPVSWPVHTDEPAIASGFGDRIHPYHKGKYFHCGIDIPAVKGTEVLAAGNGKVIKVVKSPLESGLGNFVEIEHTAGLVSRYACLQDIVVRSGQLVEQGSVIGFAGISGNAVAPHVHFEILINGQPVNPMLFLVKGFTAEVYARLTAENNLLNQSLD